MNISLYYIFYMIKLFFYYLKGHPRGLFRNPHIYIYKIYIYIFFIYIYIYRYIETSIYPYILGVPRHAAKESCASCPSPSPSWVTPSHRHLRQGVMGQLRHRHLRHGVMGHLRHRHLRQLRGGRIQLIPPGLYPRAPRKYNFIFL